ncbi:hypothetical protein [Numidum massiliense]|uniref:hypothetical protein n=1 Tax=Numidum massiliense TaxID=1522315 RepID=UPI0006D53189|nr:hypothetical protein [Numidum massiliense]
MSKKKWLVGVAILVVVLGVSTVVVAANGSDVNSGVMSLNPSEKAIKNPSEQFKLVDVTKDASADVTMEIVDDPPANATKDKKAEQSNTVTINGAPANVTKQLPKNVQNITLTEADKVAGDDNGKEATYRVSGSLGVNYAHQYGPWSFVTGETGSISLTWVPGASKVRVGLLDSSGTFYYTTLSGGSGKANFKVNKTGNYRIMVWNIGPHGINYNGYITI